MDKFLSHKRTFDDNKASTSAQTSIVPKIKSRKYSQEYLNFGFTITEVNGEEKPLCVICSKTLAADSMKPNKLKRHFETLHAIEIVETMFGDNFAKELQSIPLSNDTVSRRIDDIAEDVEQQLFGKLRDKLFSQFSLTRQQIAIKMLISLRMFDFGMKITIMEPKFKAKNLEMLENADKCVKTYKTEEQHVEVVYKTIEYHLAMLAKNVKKYFFAEDNLIASYEWVRDPFQNTPEGFSNTEEESFIDFTSSGEIKRQFCNKTLFQFWAEVEMNFLN
ncbi:zinc finger BED domain-containing protein 5 [Trichonephila clavipes]|nr:zinc finger BED domain-containing protein 5 [Trichonephila clavipes]